MSDETLLPVLDALADGALHSGETLAQHFGISRAALAKRIDHLRDWGVDVIAQAGAGYRLAAPLERLDAVRIRKALPVEARTVQLSVVTHTDSTNTQLLATDAVADPQMLFAERQTAGRGRRGREWVSPFGSNLYGSMAYSFAAWPPRLTALPLAIAVAVARVVESIGLPEVGIKWPNDLHLDGKKLAGILIEPRGEAGGSCRVVVGVGLNLAMSEAQAAGVTQAWISLASALAARGKPVPSRNTLAALLAAELATALGHFGTQGFTPFTAEWKRRDLLADQPVRIEAAEVIHGTARGVDADGGLIIETDAGRQVVHAGDVSVRRI
ncbi:MAG: biotin--[acetyl-CoA-carboxylase] ligase [Pseudomonadota bacterium]